ncbi:hypothetical protein PZ895_02435 [Mesorhizobium sp. YIM 152430]|uniref:hypothetical protein n=1 Tax=Mesorhizobium sp. YIM 152430 TaxID=3031761 RepID=UPI0023D9E927|nr:hypothetical protein [Mesorhizobium sp. YIM 152430]MDF1598633.1 hypothetical protein [Mesorhizobium sp. YIM 152430]
MIQTFLFFGLGFLTAAFIGLLFAPALRRRTERLTTRRIEARLPLTREEIQADKDRIRSEAALKQRKVEIELKAARARIAEQMVELDRQRQALGSSGDVVLARDTRIAELEAEIEAMRATIAAHDEKVAHLEDRLVSEHAVAFSRKSELDRLSALYEDASLTASSRQIEIVARETEIDRLATDLAALRNQRNETERKLRDVTADNKATREALKVETRKAEDANRRIERLLADLSDREDRLERREKEIARLRGNARASDEPDAADKIAAERDRLEKKLATLTRENKKLKSQAASSKPAPEDDAKLRDLLHQLAAEMVNLTATLEGPQSPIRKAIEAAQASGEGLPVSLAERIRALREASERARSVPAEPAQPVERNG